MKRKMDLRSFEEFALPGIEAKLSGEDLQKYVNENFDLADDGKAVEFKVKAASASTIDIASIVKTAVTDAMKPAVDALNVKRPDSIAVKGPAYWDKCLMYRPVKSFDGETVSEKKERAYKFGCLILGGVLGIQKYSDRLKEMGTVITKAQSDGSNVAGGVLVPPEWENYIITLREKYGVFRRNARMAPMSRDTLTIPRRTGGLTPYFTAEAGQLTESTKNWDAVTLTAKKLAVLAKMSSEIQEDALISIADDLADEIFWCLSLKEDQCGFLGDGTSTYGGIVGCTGAIKAVFTDWTTADSNGNVLLTGNNATDVTLTDLVQAVGNIPQYADDQNAKWYCSRFFYYNAMERLSRSAGGVTAQEIRADGQRMFAGYPVEITQVLPTADANSTMIALFGNLSKAATFGDRRETTISISDQVYWANDQVGVKATERFDIAVHDVGSTTVQGPLVGLTLAAS